MSPSNPNTENRSAWDAPEQKKGASKSALRVTAALVCAAAVAVALALLLVIRRSPSPSGTSPAASIPSAAEAQQPLTAEFEKLKGRWGRTDGDYMIELSKLLPDNALEAGYFNPGPIHVGKARLYKERGFVKVFVELQDVNYPGSKYTLIYDAEKDLLRGTYYQATQQVEYEVEFQRIPSGT